MIIPVRNEVGVIENLLESLSFQKTSQITYEVILIDDHSEDGLYETLAPLQNKFSYPLRIFKLPEDKVGKKSAVTLGVERARYDMILCTDADCLPKSSWISTMVACFTQRQNKMISGPVIMNATNFIGKIQQLEFAGLIGFGAISLHGDHPGMCNGANMAFSKKAFFEVKGYKGNEHIASGDDEFLLQKIAGKYPDRVEFVKNPDAIITTPAKESFFALIQQRLRWAGKWRFHKSIFIKSSAILSFLDFLLGVLMLLAAIKYPVLWFSLIFRFAGEWIYLNAVSRFLRIRSSHFYLLILSIIYPFFVVILGIASIFGKYSWKGRQY